MAVLAGLLCLRRRRCPDQRRSQTAATIMGMALFALVIVIGCAKAGGIKLAWDANREPDIADYRVWRGIECLATVSGTAATVTVPDEPCVLTVTARNTAGQESAHSAPLEVIAVTVEESADLKSWSPVATVHRQRKANAFYRLKLQPGGAP